MQSYVIVQQESPQQLQLKSQVGNQGTQASQMEKAAPQQLLGNSYSSQLLGQLKNSSDKSVFMRHGDIKANISIDIKYIRDMNNILGLMTESEHEEFLFAINDDTLGQICKFHNISKKDALQKMQSGISPSPQKLLTNKQKSVGAPKANNLDMNQDSADALSQNAGQASLKIYFQYFMVIELALNNQVFEPKFYTGIQNSFEVNEKIIFPVRYCDLANISLIGITIYDMKRPFAESLVAGTTIDMFDEKFRIRQGTFNLYLWPKRNADISISSQTQALFDHQALKEINVLLSKIDQNQKLTNILKDNKDWLDKLSKEAIYQRLFELYIESNDAFLEVQLPEFGFTVMYSDNMNHRLKNQYLYPSNLISQFNNTQNLNTQNDSLFSKIQQINNPNFSQQIKEDSMFSGVIKFHDPLIMMNAPDFLKRSNPITQKYYILTRDIDESGAKDLTPNSDEMDSINQIINYPDFQSLSVEQKALLWHYRYSLTSNKKALVKFLQCIEWTKEKEEQEGIRMLKKWVEIDIEQAIPLLSFMFCANKIYSPNTSFQNQYQRFNEIRSIAIKCLEKQTFDQINSIMLQLVQAYRYEYFQQSPLKKFILSKAVQDETLANSLHWHVMLEKNNDDNGEMISYYKDLYKEFLGKLSEENPAVLESIVKQKLFRKQLFALAEQIKSNKKEKFAQKKENLKKYISRGGMFDMTQFDQARPMPIDPKVYVRGIEPDKCFVFKSAMCPLKLTFYAQKGDDDQRKKEPSMYSVMYKHGDDVRQDQLVLQMISLMDNLLKQVNLDFKFTAYKVLAFSKVDGMLEFVPESKTIQDILQENKDRIEDFLKGLSPEDDKKHEEILDTYIRSCAGYCTVTYLLAVGDRHLENLLIDKLGHLFHVDFGFIFGKNPPGKNIMAPPIRICKEMVMGMGGNNHPKYELFKKKCVESFLYLRNYQRLILNLFHLMIHAGIKDLNFLEHERILTSLHEKFMPNKTNIEAEKEFVNILKESVNAFFPKVMEKFHVWAQYMK